MRRALPFALSLLLAGCAIVGRRAVAPSPPANTAPPPASPTSKAAPLLPSRFVYVGRVLAVDEPARTAIVEVSPYVTLPAALEGQTLFTRDHDLRPVARLQATSYLRGVILGVRTLEGQPAVGDEVVMPAPPPPAVAPSVPAIGAAAGFRH